MPPGGLVQISPDVPLASNPIDTRQNLLYGLLRYIQFVLRESKPCDT